MRSNEWWCRECEKNGTPISDIYNSAKRKSLIVLHVSGSGNGQTGGAPLMGYYALHSNDQPLHLPSSHRRSRKRERVT